MPTIVKMPKWGLTMTQGTIVDWILSEGSEISEGDPLLTVETEKAVDDVPAPADGILYRIVAPQGSEVAVSAPVAVILAPGESLSDEEISALVASTPPAAAEGEGPPAARRTAREGRAAVPGSGGRVNASPAARKLAAELGVDLSTVIATGPGGRITSDDVRLAADEATGGEPQERDVPTHAGGHVHVLEAGPRSAQALVFLHGLGGSLGTWQIVLGGLADRYRVVALDLPGHGGSAKPSPAEFDYSVSGLAATVEEALASLGVRNAIVAGHSLGGAVALQIARSTSGLVKALVLIDSAGLGAEIGSDLLTAMASDPGESTARKLLELFMEDRKLVSKRATDEMAGNQLSEGAWAAQQAIAGSVFKSGHQHEYSPSTLTDVTQPVLVIWGANDRVIPVSHGATAAHLIPDCLLAVLPGVGHVPQVEQPASVTRAIDRFAKSLA